MKKVDIDFQWVCDKKTYFKKIEREKMYAIFNGFVIGYGGVPGNNEISKKMIEIIPVVDKIIINQDFNETQDIPMFSYEIDGTLNVLKIRRLHNIVWSVLNGYCVE